MLRHVGSILSLLMLVSQAHAVENRDSLALFGGWRWLSSTGGLLGAHVQPPPTGWSRLLYLNRDGTYSHWERDSTADYLLSQGRHTIHRYEGSRTSTWSLWVELTGWKDLLGGNQLVAFIGQDTILTYPGSPTTGVDDALTHRYARDSTPAPTKTSVHPRPPRVQSVTSNWYFVDLDSARWEAMNATRPFHQWMDWQYPRTIRESYRYRHDQIPSAVIGDFDADSVMDVVIHGSTGYAQSKVVCVLSNKGLPRTIQLIEEPTHLDPLPPGAREGHREPRPTLFLRLLRAGEAAKTLEGAEISFSSDAVLVARPNGYATPYVFESDSFRTGEPIAIGRWNLTDPREQR